MKRRLKIIGIMVIAMLTLFSGDIYAKPKKTKVYVFGISTNFTDSITYITDIQTLEAAYIETKTGFLYDRSIYAQQLQIWVEQVKLQPYTTCAIFFNESKSKLEKKYKKIQDKYYKDQSTIVQLLEPEEFEFKQLDWSEHERL
jgi:hypothetical protein